MDELRWNKIISKKLNKIKNDDTFEIVKLNDDEKDAKYLIMFKLIGGHYKNQIHILTMDLKNQKSDVSDWFPVTPPKVYFLTEIAHTNVSPGSGWICLDILADKWSPMNGFDTLVQTIILLLDDPAPTGNHLNAEVAKIQQKAQQTFNKLSKILVNQYGEEYDVLYENCFRDFDELCKIKYLTKKNNDLIKKHISKFSKFKYEDTLFAENE